MQTIAHDCNGYLFKLSRHSSVLSLVSEVCFGFGFPQNSEDSPFASLSLLAKAEKEETQLPMKWFALPNNTRSS